MGSGGKHGSREGMTGHYTGQKFIAWVTLAVLVAGAIAVPAARADDTVINQNDASTTITTGSSATTGDNSVASTDGDASIQSGDASAGAGAQNSINTNDTTLPQDEDASSTVVNDNTASTTNAAAAAASTGGNAAQTGGGSASVSTGNAYASANIINVVNTNLVNSTGLFDFLNEFFSGGINLDTPDLNGLFGQGGAGGNLSLSNNNAATTQNSVTVSASTGGNSASGGSASVTTGNAYASANVVNVVNTNIVNSNYLLVALNNFGDLAGDITLPGASFFNQLLGSSGKSAASTTVENDNAAVLTDGTGAVADTGGNTASSTGGDSSVSTGNSLAQATTYNQVNGNLTGGSTVYMLINVFGNWSGAIQNLPAGLSWEQTPTGVAIMGSGSGTGGTGSPTSVLASNANTASVENNVQVYALTGSNEVASGAGDASISTGNAYASANVVNLVNTNVIGQNWMLAILNVFGDWNGNLAFGEPDLWIGGVAETPNPTPSGGTVTYDFTVANHGDADAHNVVLTASFDQSMLSFESYDASSTQGVSWNLGDIPAGQTEEFSYTATAGEHSGTAVAVPLSATVAEDETDADLADNTENVTIMVGDSLPSTGGGASIGAYTPPPKLTISKTESTDATSSPATVDYTVVIDNDQNAGPAYDAMLTDSLVDPTGSEVYHNSWSLDTIQPGDEVTLKYSVEFSTTSLPGAYVNTATLTGVQNYPELPYANPLAPVATSTTLELSGGEVLGAETDLPSSVFGCLPLLTSYLSPGAHNDGAQVKLLQYFLEQFEGAPLSQTGVYDPATTAAVSAFQQTYASDVLSPWGLSDPSGSVYYLTQKKINELYCQGRAQFPLSSAQANEILAFKSAHVPQPSAVAVQPVLSPLPLTGVFKFSMPQAAAALAPQANNSFIFDLGHLMGNYGSMLGVPLAHAAGN